MKITVLFNSVKTVSGRPQDILADEDSVETAGKIQESLKTLGHQTELLEVLEDNQEKLLAQKPDVFFNSAFGIGSIPKSESDVTDLLETTGIPYTGSNSEAIILTTDKIGTKKLLSQNNLPITEFQTFKTVKDQLKAHLRFPLIVKPAMEDCSLGIDIDSVVEKESQLRNKLLELAKSYDGPYLVEEFIDGRELNITVFGNDDGAVALPISEILFDESYKNKPKVISFAGKWEEASADYQGTLKANCPAILEPEIKRRVQEISVEAFKITGCRDYARIDVRLDKDNKAYILEVNANPGIGPEDGVIRSAKAAGLSYPQFLQKIVDFALARSSMKIDNL